MLKDVKIFYPASYKDNRGELWTIYNENDINLKFNHDKVSVSKKNVLRGLHGDKKSWKLITCLYGEIFLSLVDYRENSETYLKSQNFILK